MKRNAACLALLLSFIGAGLCLVPPGYTQKKTPAAAPGASAVAEGAMADKPSASQPKIEIHPEFFLGWTQPEQPPPPPKRLPWPLKITLTAVNASNEVIAGPMSVTTTEELVGSRFRKASVTPAASVTGLPPPAAATSIPTTGGVSSVAGGTTTARTAPSSSPAVVPTLRPARSAAQSASHSAAGGEVGTMADKPAFTTAPASAIQLQELEFASLVDTRGAGFMNLKCFVRLTLAENGHAEQVQTLTTVECRPDRETTLATFGGLSLKILVGWNDTTD
ncbi:MAG: hypothetical protein HY343_08820 [Lentisphaerae bacterium]|nr:hypothetical protein [Lentisphaerota bacterium]